MGRTAGALAILLMTVCCYVPAISGGFIWDDQLNIVENEPLRTAGGLQRIWFERGGTPYQYYPLVHTSYWIEYRFWQASPVGYHVVNILLHGLGAVLAWRVLALLRVPHAWFVAAVFALHPVQVESVAWITERKNVLSGVFFFAAALAYLRHALPPSPATRRNGGWYVASLALFVCAVLSKSATSVLPAALLLVLWWRQRLRKGHVTDLAPFFAVGVGLGLLSAWLERAEVGASGPDWDHSIVERLLIAGRAVWFYAGKLLLPTRLTFVYPRWEIDAAAALQYVYPAGALAGAGALWLLRRRIGLAPLVAVLYFVGVLFPALGLFNVFFMRYAYVADHWQYLACVGPLALFAAVGSRLADRAAPGAWGGAGGRRGSAPLSAPLKVALAAAVLGALGLLTWRQAAIYEDGGTIWADTLRKSPGAWMAHSNLGQVLADRGEHEAAIRHYRRAIELRPRYREAHVNLANALARTGRTSEALDVYQLAIAIDPGHPEAHFNLGVVLATAGDSTAAAAAYEAALRRDPRHVRALNNLALLLMDRREPERALALLDRAVGVAPRDPKTRLHRGILYGQLGRTPAAAGELRRAVELSPDYARARFLLGVALLTMGRNAEARVEIARATALDPRLAERLPPAITGGQGSGPDP